MRLSIILFATLFLIGCSHKESRKQKEAREQIELKTKQQATVSAMVSKYSANDSSFKVLEQNSGLLTTLRLQQVFQKTSSYPFLLYANVKDAFEQDGQYFATFKITASSLEYLIFPSSTILLELKCTQKQTEELFSQDSTTMSRELSYFSGCLAIVVKVNDVQKIKLGFEATPVSYEEAYIELIDSNISIIKGELLDFCVFQW